MVESDPPRFVCSSITMFLRLHNAQCCKVDMQSSHDALWLRFGCKVKVGDNGHFGFKTDFLLVRQAHADGQLLVVRTAGHGEDCSKQPLF
jgi:hypothetical protein